MHQDSSSKFMASLHDSAREPSEVDKESAAAAAVAAEASKAGLPLRSKLKHTLLQS
jgi:hypothetical protein